MTARMLLDDSGPRHLNQVCGETPDQFSAQDSDPLNEL